MDETESKGRDSSGTSDHSKKESSQHESQFQYMNKSISEQSAGIKEEKSDLNYSSVELSSVKERSKEEI